MAKRKHNIEIDKFGSHKIVIKGNNLNLQWISIPTISKHCILVYYDKEAEDDLKPKVGDKMRMYGHEATIIDIDDEDLK